MIRALVALAAILVTAAAPASSQPVAATTGAPTASASDTTRPLTVWLMTMGQGDEVWELFGHNAIRIRDRSRGTDTAYNWGMFSFDEPNFLGRFLTGDNHYWMEGYPTAWIVEGYKRRNRSIIEQRLNLTDAQATALRDFIDWNSRPENKFYRYDYFLDNCSTRVRDALDRALGGQLRAALARTPTNTTYRWHTRRLVQRELATYTGIEIALGEPADRPITAWEEAFLPTRLSAHLRDVTVHDSLGRAVPLVAEEEQLFAASRAPEPERPPSFVPGYVVLGLVLAAIIVALAVRAATPGSARTSLAVVGTAWMLLAGLLGIVLVLAWTLTRHVFWYDNENLLQLTPLALLLGIALPGFTRRRRYSTFVTRLALVIAGLSLLGLLLKVLPAFRQYDWEVIALALPVNLSLAWSIQRLERRREVIA